MDYAKLSEKEKLVVHGTLVALQNVGTDHEADAIERCAIKAGFWWKCEHEPDALCGYVNPAEVEKCENCGRSKPKEES